MFRFTTVVVRLKSIKDLSHVYEVHLGNLKDTLKCFESFEDLEKARLEILELLAIVENKQEMLYDKNHQ